MNILSLLSAMLATAMWIGGLYCFTRNRKTQLNVFSLIVLFLLGWWSFCNVFFFSAQTAADAMFWHKLASLGWTGFIAATAYYFIVLTEFDSRMNNALSQFLYYGPIAVLMIHNLFADTTSLATGITKSIIGSQWTFVNTVKNVWLWIYIAVLLAYFGFSFVLLIRWAIKVKHKMKRHMAFGFVALDFLTIALGFVTDILFPVTNQLLPSVANLCTAIFAMGYFFIIIRFDVFNFRHIVEDRIIIEQSLDSVMVTDEKAEILDVNLACCRMFDMSSEMLIGKNASTLFRDDLYKDRILSPLSENDKADDVRLSLNTDNLKEKYVSVSASVIRDKHNEYVGTVLSMRDITQLCILQRLYQEQSEEYRKLAYLDALTDLPNRRQTFEYINTCAFEYEESKRDFFVIYTDLDRFKSINDRYGHHIGDIFLKEAVGRLKKCLNNQMPFLARLGGDEFLFAGYSDNEQSLQELIQIIESQFDSDLVCEGIAIHSGISAGYAVYSECRSVDEMLHAADEMMYIKKQSKKVKEENER